MLALVQRLDDDMEHTRAGGQHIICIHERSVSVMVDGTRGVSNQVEADRFVQSLGLRPLGSAWIPIDGGSARILGLRLLANDLAYGQPMMSEDQAKNLATRFISFLPGAHWHGTNRWPVGLTQGQHLTPEHTRGGWGGWTWNALSEHIFDGAVVAINATHIGLLRVADDE